MLILLAGTFHVHNYHYLAQTGVEINVLLFGVGTFIQWFSLRKKDVRLDFVSNPFLLLFAATFTFIGIWTVIGMVLMKNYVWNGLILEIPLMVTCFIQIPFYKSKQIPITSKSILT